MRGDRRPANGASRPKTSRPITRRAYLRCRIFARMRRFLRPIFLRPFPVFFVPTALDAPTARNDSLVSSEIAITNQTAPIEPIAYHPRRRN